MTSTIHIFDEFDFPDKHLTDSILAKKRYEMEKIIFSILKTRYGTLLHNFWKSYNPPKISTKQIVIIERRIHENLEFILHNCAWAGRDGNWSLAIVCSDINLNYVKSIVGEKSVQIIPYFQGNPSSEKGKEEYNQLLQTKEFYNWFTADNLCLVEMDCYFLKPIPESVTSCDFIASPYAWQMDTAGGGLSFRKRKTMIDICEKITEKYPCQDVYISDGIVKLGYSMPPVLYSKEICAESILYCDPVGVHQWWTFFNPQLEGAIEIFERFMKIDIYEL